MTPTSPLPGSLRDLTTGLAHLATHLTTLSQDDPRRQQVVHDYQAQRQQLGDARRELRALTS